ncbi:hypothetical protein [Gaetbulibacter sp. PBL-D1]|uniref:hypothetical protein n=1 Tax=Gaetbulibacter sp. PBL-D1 TaxID=3422594 RepID=UPI003D2F1785
MGKKVTSLAILIIFSAFLAAPTIISIVDKDFNVAAFYSVNEEENSQNEISKNVEVKFLDNSLYDDLIVFDNSIKHNSHYQINYSSLSLENLSPPPEQHIL